jgi:hypothetical protein
MKIGSMKTRRSSAVFAFRRKRVEGVPAISHIRSIEEDKPCGTFCRMTRSSMM